MSRLCGASLFLVQAHHSDWAITTGFLDRTLTAEALIHCKGAVAKGHKAGGQDHTWGTTWW